MNTFDSVQQTSERSMNARPAIQHGRVRRVLMALAVSAGAVACSASDDTEALLEDGAALDDLDPGAAGTDVEDAVEEPVVDDALALEIAQSKLPLADAAGDVEKHATCGTNGSTASSVRNNDAPSNGAANQRSGSSTGCVAVGVLQPTDDALYFCFTFANDGNTWTYNQNLRTGVRGWTRDDLLDDFGSFTHCGF